MKEQPRNFPGKDHNSDSLMEHGKVPPNAMEFEEAVLGACMLESEALREVTQILVPESFYRLENQRVFEAIMSLYATDEPVDIMTVAERLNKRGHLKMIGGPYFVSKLTDRVASLANAEYHARIIHQKYIQRELIRVCGDTYHDAFDDTCDPLEVLDSLSNRAEKIAAMLSGSSAQSVADHMRSVIASVRRVQSGELMGLSTGFVELDRLQNGRQKGELIVIAGRPSMGKSAVALSEAIHMAEQRRQVAFFSLEMGGSQLAKRMMGIDTSIYLNRFKSGEIDEEQFCKLEACVKKWEALGFHLIDDVLSLSGIKAEVRRIKEKHGLDVVYIDYLQLVEHGLRGRNRENEVSEVSRAFKLMAKSLNIPVILLSQLSRSVETRGGNKRPMLSDLRESGAIEQDADIVEFIYRPEYYGIEVDEESGIPGKGLAVRIVAKNRDGELADLPMRFQHALTRFTDWTPMQEPCSAEFARQTTRPSTNSNAMEYNTDLPF